MKKYILPLFLIMLLVGCIGTDFEDDPKDSAIMIDVTSLSLMKGDTEQITATYWYNMWVQDSEVKLNWLSSDPSIASVDQSGLVTANERGQTALTCFVVGEDTLRIAVSVVENANDIAKVKVSGAANSLIIGETLQLSAESLNTEDEVVTPMGDTVWESSDESIATVDINGLTTAMANGQTTITATIDDIVSEPFPLVVGRAAKVGVFMDAGGYKTSGMAILSEDETGQVILELSSDFDTDFAVGTFLYLANSTTGNVIKAQGLEVSEISGDGAATYNLTEIDPTITLDTYQYVISLCKPFAIPFGIAELK